MGGYTMGGMMGPAMGRGYAAAAYATPWYMLPSIVALAGILVAGILGFVYYMAYPQIRLSSPGRTATEGKQPAVGNLKTSWSMLLRTSKPDEKKVLEVLAAHNGAYLQKFIVKESELSKLRTHRIISRFVERGIVTAVRSGNTNDIKLADWLKESATTET